MGSGNTIRSNEPEQAVEETFKKKERKPREKKPKAAKESSGRSRQYKSVLGLLLMGISLFMALAFTSFIFTWRMDQSQVGMLGNADVKESEYKYYIHYISDDNPSVAYYWFYMIIISSKL